MQEVFPLLMACGITDAPPDFGGRVLPRKELQVAPLYGTEVAALELRAFQVIAARPEGDDAFDIRQFQCAIDPRAAMTAGRKANPVGVVIEVNERHRLSQVSQQGRGEMVIVTGADKEDFWRVGTGFRALLQSIWRAIC